MKCRYARVALLALPLSGCAVAFGPAGQGRLPVTMQAGSGCAMPGHDPLAEPMERHSSGYSFFSVRRAVQAYQSRARAMFTPAASAGGISVQNCPSQGFPPLPR